MLRRLIAATFLLALLGPLSACDKAFLPLSSTSSCGDRCKDLDCPRGTYCQMNDGCTPRCEQQNLTSH